MAKFIRSFTEIRKEDVPLAGGKGANLGEMVSAGISVPEGGVLCSGAYDLFMELNGIEPERMAAESVSEKEASEKIRQAVLTADMPEVLADDVRAFYRSYGENARVAVRSSTTAEDLEDASFAGQQETYLNVTSEKELLHSIKACYASLWGVRAMHYRRESGYGEGKVSLAVVIQSMVESETAGVVFTRDPGGNTENILVNASYGLGEAVVSGLVSPDEYTCDRNGNLLNAVTGSKEWKIVYADNGTVRVPVSEDERRRRVLDDETLHLLVSEALRIETHYGRPMDIEWAVADGKVYILQARAITTLQESGTGHFTDRDFEGLPAPKPVTGRMRENMLFNLEKLPVPYYPLDQDFGFLVGRQKEVLFAEAGIKMPPETQMTEDGISSFTLGGKMRVNGKIVRLPGLLRQMKDHEWNIKKSADELGKCRELYEAECRKTPDTLKEYAGSLSVMQDLIQKTAYARFRYAIFPQVLENMSLNRVLRKMDPGLNSFDLMEGLSYVTADINRSMADIAAKVRKVPGAVQDLMNLSLDAFSGKHPDIAGLISEFMEKYGCRSDFNCYCFMAKSWHEDPGRFLHALRAVVRGDEGATPSLEEGVRKFEALMERAKDRLGEKRYRRFEEKVRAVRHYHVIREATQYLWECEFERCRKLLRGIAEGLHTDYDDLLYLFADELYAACMAGSLDEKTRQRMLTRKEKRPMAEAWWTKSISVMLETGSGDITGVCGSGGKATGRACIIRSPEEFGRLSEGDILVCPYTDPEWTPLFTMAAGVVVNTGGTLSHAAIVAREYRIPAVLATGNATEKIRDGQMIMVDGDSGRVLVV